jgi:hypothetical protein
MVGHHGICPTSQMECLLTCTDPAQLRLAELRIDAVLAKKLKIEKIPPEAIALATELLTWTTDKLTQVQLEADSSIEVFTNIVHLALQHDEDNLQEYMSILVYYLQSEGFQQKVTKPTIFKHLLDLMLEFEERLLRGPNHNYHEDLYQLLEKKIDLSSEPSEEVDVVLMAQLINSLSAMSSTDAFIKHFTITDPAISTLISLFDIKKGMAPNPTLICGCVVLGNLTSNDAVAEALVHTYHIHDYIKSHIFGSNLLHKPALSFAAAGLYRHLAFPENNRSELLHDSVIDDICSLFQQDQQPSVRGEGAAILAKLVSNNLTNIEIVLTKVVGHQLPELEDLEVHPAPRAIEFVVANALVPSKPLPSTSMKNTPIELGRTIVNILRTLGQPNPEYNEKIRHMYNQLFKTPLVARPVARLIHQRFYPDARTEGLLGLGLMTQSREGVTCVTKELRADTGLLDAIRELCKSADGAGGQRAGQGLRRDQQNALVLFHGLVKNGIEDIDMDLKDSVDMLVHELSRDITNIS